MLDRIVPEWLGVTDRIGAFSTGRAGGTSLAPFDDGAGQGGLNLGMNSGDAIEQIQQNRSCLRAYLPAEPVWLRQVHGTDVINAASVDQTTSPVADASFTTTPGVVCAVLTADCLPVLLCDLSGEVVAAAHAGWRGLAAGILQNTVAAMRDAGATDVSAWLGPAIGPDQFEVGADVFAAFVGRDRTTIDAFKPVVGVDDKYFADLNRLARIILGKSGVTRIVDNNLCTVSMPKRFFSYRRDCKTGRMASLIWIK
jgi:YfiH family protein